MFQLSRFEQETPLLSLQLPSSHFFLKFPFLRLFWLKCQRIMNFASWLHFFYNLDVKIFVASNNLRYVRCSRLPSVDSNLKFEKHINELCKIGNQKLHTLALCDKYMSNNKSSSLFKNFVVSQFHYCPLLWIFHTKELNNQINSPHENVLRLTYQKSNSSFDELLKLDKSDSTHCRNLQYLLT